MLGDPVQQMSGLRVVEPVDEFQVPSGQRLGAPLPPPVPARARSEVRAQHDAAARRLVATGGVVQRVQVAGGETRPHVRGPQHAREHAG